MVPVRQLRARTALRLQGSLPRALALLGCLTLVACVGDVEDGADDEVIYDDAGNVIGTPADGGWTTDGAVPGFDAGAQGDAGGWSDGGVTNPQLDAGGQWNTDAGAAQDAGTGADAATGSDAGSSTPDAAAPVDNSVPAGSHCDPVRNWNPEWVQFEDEVLRLTNEARATARTCGSKGSFAATTPVTAHPALRCSARLHSKYMADNKEFAHDQAKTGKNPFQRMTEAGYVWSTASENIAAGQPTPKAVVDGWLKSEGHCTNIMSRSMKHLGVGLFVPASGSGAPYRQYWTQNFAAPR